MKPTTLAGVLIAAVAILVGICAARASEMMTVLAWDPNDAADKVSGYIVQFRPRGNSTNGAAWSEVLAPATPAPSISLPVAPFGTEFRLAASNAFGRSPWTETFFLPAAARGLRLVLPLSP
jgi:hypothetical protein